MSDLSNVDVFLEKIKELPQYPHIREEDARQWHATVMELDPERVEWHFNRLDGLGGSDVGEVTAWKLGHYNTFKTPRDIVDEKLLRKPITPPNEIMRRGTYLESTIQRIFLEDMQGQTRSDLIAKVEATKDPDHPWMNSNLDDIVEIGGYNFIVDYKAPSKAKPKVPIQYAGQVHQYGHLFKVGIGERPCSHIVASFDYENGVVVPVEVPFCQTIMDAVLEGGDEVWNHVLNGTYPPYRITEKEEVEYSEDELRELAHLEEEFLRFKLISDEAIGRGSTVSDRIQDLLNRDGETLLKGTKLPFEVLTGSIRQKLDQDKAMGILAEAGVNHKDFMKLGKKLDEDKVLSALSEYFDDQEIQSFYETELDTDKVLAFCEEKKLGPPVTESISVSFKSNKKSLDKQAVENAKESARVVVEQGAASLDLGDDEQEESFSPSAA